MKNNTIIIIAVIGFCVICLISVVSGGLYVVGKTDDDEKPMLKPSSQMDTSGSSLNMSLPKPFNEGDLVKYSWVLPQSASDLCAPSEGKVKNMTAYGKVQSVEGDNVGVLWTNVRNKNPRKGKYDHQCCWNRDENEDDWNIKYWGDGSIDPSYNSGLQSQFSLQDAKRNFVKVKSVPDCPEPDIFRKCKTNKDCEAEELCLCPHGEAKPEWCKTRGQRCRPKEELKHDKSMPAPWCHNSIVQFYDEKHKKYITVGDKHNYMLYHKKPDDIFGPNWELRHRGGGQFEIVDRNLRRAIVAGGNYNGGVIHDDARGARNALWRFYKIPNSNRYYIIDEKHKAAIVAGDLYDGLIRHQSQMALEVTEKDGKKITKQVPRLSAEWNVKFVDEDAPKCRISDDSLETPIFPPTVVKVPDYKKMLLFMPKS